MIWCIRLVLAFPWLFWVLFRTKHQLILRWVCQVQVGWPIPDMVKVIWHGSYHLAASWLDTLWHTDSTSRHTFTEAANWPACPGLWTSCSYLFLHSDSLFTKFSNNFYSLSLICQPDIRGHEAPYQRLATRKVSRKVSCYLLYLWWLTYEPIHDPRSEIRKLSC